jgi:rhamnogalacturonyl hydrolase YesR
MKVERDLIKSKLSESLDKLETWVESNDYKGYEPFDGQSSYLYPLTFRVQYLERILQQIVRRSRLNLRPLLGITKKESTKGRGYMAWGYLTRYKTTGDDQYKRKAFQCLDWLIENKSPEYDELSWGNHFQFTSRGGRLKKHEPIIVWTSLIGHAYIEAYELFKVEKYLDAAKSIGNWVLQLPREKTDHGSCISYIMRRQSSIHNSNMLGAGFLAHLSTYWKENDQLLPVAREAMEYSCYRQNDDGSWYYGEHDHFKWIDNFHTGYNLDSLKCYIEKSGDTKYEENLRKGLSFYIKNFFEESGRPKYYNNKTFPVDSQCISQSIETLANFSEYDPSALELSIKVALWAIENMQDKKGFFYFRQYPFFKDKTPMLHWAQATMYRALSLLLDRVEHSL